MNAHETTDGWERLSPDDGHYAFGYYDRNPWSADNALHLALRIPQGEHLPQVGETAEVGVIEVASRRFHRLATTRAWCHQQGAMTLWLPHRPGCFIFNDWDAGEGRLVARICSLERGIIGSYSRPIYALSPDGRRGASLSFARIPRRGYSYADATLDLSPPDEAGDGIFMVDMLSGESRLAISYGQMFAKHPAPFLMEGRHSWLNHIIFNCDSSKILYLLRHCLDVAKPYPWQTHMYTAAIDGSDLCCPLPDFYWKWISHQIWGRTPNEVLVDANWQGRGNEYVVFDERIRPLQAERVSRGMGPHGHLVFSPDGTRMLADTYPIDGVQTLAMVDVASGDWRVIGRFTHEQPAGSPEDVRCDLHPRWSADGARISVDSIHTGLRGIYGFRPA